MDSRTGYRTKEAQAHEQGHLLPTAWTHTSTWASLRLRSGAALLSCCRLATHPRDMGWEGTGSQGCVPGTSSVP